jgi:flagellar biogenesis protein FliO
MKSARSVGLDSAKTGLGAWLLSRLKQRFNRREGAQARLVLVERITLAPRQSLALIEAEGRRFLVATSTEGVPAFLALDHGARTVSPRLSRLSW